LNANTPSLAGAQTAAGSPQLRRLTPDMVAACNAYLDAHFDAAAQDGKSPVVMENYQPMLDGRPTTIAAVVQALGPLTLLNPVDELTDLVLRRYNSLVVAKAQAALQQATQRGAQSVTDKDKPADVATRREAESALVEFLNKVLAAQGGRAVRITEPVQRAGRMLADGDINAGLAIQAYLQGHALPGAPAALAGEIAKRLPPTIPRANLERMRRISPKEITTPGAKSLSELVAGVFSKEVDAAVKLLPKAWQDKVRKGVNDAIAAGLVKLVEAAMAGSPLDDKTKEAIGKGVEAAIKLKADEAPMDRKQDTEGSPDAPTPPPSSAPKPDEAPGEKIITSPDVDIP
jgi:hypothetical protein